VSKLIRKRRTAGIVAVMVAGVAGASAYAFTASNTGLVDHKAGASAAVVSGYTVSNVSYTWDSAGANVTKVEFDLDAAANDVKAALTAAAPTAASDWTDCGAAAAITFHVTCTLGSPVANANADKLSVVAVETGTATIS
jgi:hypothetical protein